jgi:opacity protein-like surface antigen
MKRSILNTFLGIAAGVAVFAGSASAQVEERSQISIQGTGLFTKSTNDQTPTNKATNSGGFLVGYGYQFNNWLGAEGNYGYTRDTQNFLSFGGPTSLQTDFHQVTGSLVVHIPVHVHGVRPYALAGGGAIVFDPTEKFVVSGADRQTRGTFVYGGGANFDITRNFGLRAEYRGLVYKVPDFNVSGLAPDKFTHLAQPSFGFFFRF